MQKDIVADRPLTETSAYETYESTMQPYRMRFDNVLETLLADRNPRTLMLFWIYFSANGVGMTEPVEGWIRRAGDRCKALGYNDLGEQLCKHAVHESDHHLMMIEDTKRLVTRWNQLYTPPLEAETILDTPADQIVIAYQDLHEHTIHSDHPYGQITIEYEIENLSVVYGTTILKHALEVLGKDIAHDLSFVDEHVRIDVAHTKYNRKALNHFLTNHPQTLPELIETGKKALNAYWAFLENCHKKSLAL